MGSMEQADMSEKFSALDLDLFPLSAKDLQFAKRGKVWQSHYDDFGPEQENWTSSKEVARIFGLPIARPRKIGRKEPLPLGSICLGPQIPEELIIRLRDDAWYKSIMAELKQTGMSSNTIPQLARENRRVIKNLETNPH